MANDAAAVAGQVVAADAERAAALVKEGKSLLDDDPEKAVELLCEAVRSHEKLFGSDALECADPYLWYGVALYEVARNATDALGNAKTVAQPPTATATGGAGPSGSGGGAPERPQGKPEAPAKEEAGGEESIKAPLPAGGDASDDASDADGDAKPDDADAKPDAAGGGEGEEGGSPSNGDDMQLAWEMVELARLIFSKHGPENHHSKLAEAHKTLGDILGEQEKFEEAADAYRVAVQHLASMAPQPLRRLAEVQYKLSLALTFADAAEAALEATRAALGSLGAAVAEVESQLSALPTDGSGGEAAEAEGEALAATAEDLRGVMAELRHNCEGLVEQVAARRQLKDQIKHAFMAVGGGAAGAAAAKALVAAAQGTTGGAGAAAAERPFAASTAPAASSAQPVSLGVVGRGTKRITLQPAAAAPAAAAPAAAPSVAPSAGDAGATAPKRSFAEATAGDTAATGAAEAEAAGEQGEAKKARAGAASDEASA